MPQQQPPQFIWNFKVGDRCLAKYWEGKYIMQYNKCSASVQGPDCNIDLRTRLHSQMRNITMPKSRRSPKKHASFTSSNTATPKKYCTPIACQSPNILCRHSIIFIRIIMPRHRRQPHATITPIPIDPPIYHDPTKRKLTLP